jgi:uncharacterized membrane protein
MMNLPPQLPSAQQPSNEFWPQRPDGREGKWAHTPEPYQWRNFFEKYFLYSGCLALVMALGFFIAYNWEVIGKLAKFSLVEVFMVASVVWHLKVPTHSRQSRLSLLLASLSLGVLLALFGQTYQTGADTWELFFNWALLILPWTVLGRCSALWMLWIGLINTTIVLYHNTFQIAFLWFPNDERSLLWCLFIFNMVVVLVLEGMSQSRLSATERWGQRCAYILPAFAITWLVCMGIVHSQREALGPALIWCIFLGYSYYFYRHYRPDLFMLACGCMSVISVVIAFLGHHLLDRHSEGAFLLLAAVVIGIGSGSALWLKKLHHELFQSSASLSSVSRT